MNESTLSTIEVQQQEDHAFFSTKDPFRLAYGCLDTFVLISGVSLNCLLIYLIRQKTVSAMKMYKNLLMMSCVMDLMVSCWTFVVQPFPVVDHGYRMILMNGFFRNSSQSIRYAAYLVWIQLMLFFLITTMSQYVYRFCILCRNGAMPSTIFWSLMFAQVFLNASHACVLVWADYPRAEDAFKMAEMKQHVGAEAGITDINFVSFIRASDIRWLSHNAIMLVIIPIFYGVIFFCFDRIRKAINEMNVLKIREYNKQVSAALLFQALLPTFEICAWCIQMTLPLIVIEESTVLAVIFTDIPIHLVPVLNPLGTIFLVAPYRRAVLSYLRYVRANTQTSIMPLKQRVHIRNTGSSGVVAFKGFSPNLETKNEDAFF